MIDLYPERGLRAMRLVPLPFYEYTKNALSFQEKDVLPISLYLTSA